MTNTMADEMYKVNVNRESDDLYKDTLSNSYIKTRYCYEYVYYQDAILDATTSKLIFGNNRECDVDKILR
jgi:hypothetical protein